MSLTMAQIRATIRKTTGQDIVTLPDADATVNGVLVIGVNTFLNRAWWDFLDKVDIVEKDQTSTFAAVVGTALYAPAFAATMEAVRRISYNNPDDNRQVVLVQKDMDWYRNNQSTNVGDYDDPLYYINEGASLYLAPTPDRVLTFNVDLWRLLDDTDISGVNSPRETAEIIQYGATWRVFSDLNGNIVKASYYKKLVDDLINSYEPVKSKQKEDLPTAGLNYLGREY